MIDLFAVFDKRGVLLFLHNPLSMNNFTELLNDFIQCALIDHVTQPIKLVSNHAAQYLAQSKVVLVCVYPRDLPQLDYIPNLLGKCALYVEGKCHLTDRSIEGFDESVLDTLVHLAETEAATCVPNEASQKVSSVTNKRKTGGTEKGRKWGLSKEEQKSLDYSQKSLNDSNSSPASSSHKSSNNSDTTTSVSTLKSVSKELEELKASQAKPEKPNMFWGAIQAIAGGKELNDVNLKEPLKVLNDHLIGKNVAPPVASLICDRVRADLKSQRTSAFATLKSQVELSAEKAIKTLIASESPSQFLAHVKQQTPYVMAFVGVNGVGKSTSLAKVAAWLLANDLSVLLVAGDTFRAGAVEQLGKHARNLGSIYEERVSIFEKGYGRDAAQVAEAAVQQAKSAGTQVVLIDTAGRMPNNSQLMRALSDLVQRSRPHRVLFVGEALAGNEALVQLTHFNAALEPRGVDALLVSKYDTVDDKVGAVVNMCHTARAPVLFVGSGQTFGDLKTLSPSTVIQLLLQ